MANKAKKVSRVRAMVTVALVAKSRSNGGLRGHHFQGRKLADIVQFRTDMNRDGYMLPQQIP